MKVSETIVRSIQDASAARTIVLTMDLTLLAESGGPIYHLERELVPFTVKIKEVCSKTDYNSKK